MAASCARLKGWLHLLIKAAQEPGQVRWTRVQNKVGENLQTLVSKLQALLHRP